MARSLPDVIPLFPLPNVVHFPRVVLPLHIFEARYRALLRDALAGTRLIGMVLLRADRQVEDPAIPPVFERGTAGDVVRSEELADGRFNIVLRGVREFRILEEVRRTPYRAARVEWRTEATGVLAPAARARLADLVGEFARRRHPEVAGRFAPPADDELFVNLVSQQLGLPVIERQALLEADGLDQRAERLVEVLEFHLEALRSSVVTTARPQ
jgi:Lon protease-like protein